MRTSPTGIALIKKFEGCRLVAYRDVAGVLSIGWGETGPHVHAGMEITQALADRMLADRLAREFEPGVTGAIGGTPVTQNQFDAMVSLAYNIGVGGFRGSTVARMHKAGDHLSAAEAFELWNRADGRIIAGLVRRREEERDLYLSPAGTPPQPQLQQLADFEQAARALQQELADQGFYRGAVDSIWGPVSQAALTAWRAAQKEKS